MKKMKNVYVKPEMDVMEITVESMIATSTSTIPVVPGENDEDPRANDHRGSWGNLWE